MKRRLPPPCPVWGAAPSGYGRMMRGRVISRSPFGDPEVSNGFMRGFISAGLVAVTAGSMPARKEALRLALQGGTAMAAGIAGANAIDRRDYGSALLAVAAGAVGLSAINRLLPESTSSEKEVTHEQEVA